MSTYCNMIQKGMFVSHQGQSLCCINKHKFKDVSPKEFWYGNVRKNALEQMHNQSPVNGCDTCYHHEANRVSSSRTFYNSYNHVPTKNLPTMLDLDFSNFCNLKCVMCDPARSSQHAKDIGKGISSLPRQYLDSLLEISDEVRQITIQGGEPSIMEEFIYFFEELNKKGITKNINLQIISNLTNLNEKFTNLLTNFKQVRLSISLDAYGKANDYIRWPSKFYAIEKNIDKILQVDTINKVEILNTLNILSMFNYKDFLSWSKSVEDKYRKNDREFVLVPMKVFNPAIYSPFIAPLSLKELFINDIKDFFATSNFHKDSKTKIEMMLLCRTLQRSNTDHEALKKLSNTVTDLDRERSVEITNFIPNFHEHIQKSQ